jgi:hypothetical protein
MQEEELQCWTEVAETALLQKPEKVDRTERYCRYRLKVDTVSFFRPEIYVADQMSTPAPYQSTGRRPNLEFSMILSA